MITVYGRDDCVQCHWTKRWLERLGHTYRAVDVDQDTEAQKAVEAMGFGHLPVVVTETDTWAGFKLDKLRGIPRRS